MAVEIGPDEQRPDASAPGSALRRPRRSLLIAQAQRAECAQGAELLVPSAVA